MQESVRNLNAIRNIRGNRPRGGAEMYSQQGLFEIRMASTLQNQRRDDAGVPSARSAKAG